MEGVSWVSRCNASKAIGDEDVRGGNGGARRFMRNHKPYRRLRPSARSIFSKCMLVQQNRLASVGNAVAQIVLLPIVRRNSA